MDVDNNEIDLISQFRSMRTNDKECLIEEFRRLSNTELTNEGCAFYLDLANWNLNTALWAYYEYGIQDPSHLPSMKFMCDVTIGGGESVTPNTKFIKIWRIKNSGNTNWPPGCTLRQVNGINLRDNEFIIVSALESNEMTDVSVEFMSPNEPGLYQCQFKLFTPIGTPFGDPIWLVLQVEDGVLSITQQFNNVNILGNSLSTIFLNNSASLNQNNVRFDVNNNSNTTNLLIKSNALSNTRINDLDNNCVSIDNSKDEDERPTFYDDMFS